jgi:hypothetical protein
MLLVGGDCRTRWGTLVRSDMGLGVAGKSPATPVISCTLSTDEPSFFVLILCPMKKLMLKIFVICFI